MEKIITLENNNNLWLKLPKFKLTNINNYPLNFFVFEMVYDVHKEMLM